MVKTSARIKNNREPPTKFPVKSKSIGARAYRAAFNEERAGFLAIVIMHMRNSPLMPIMYIVAIAFLTVTFSFHAKSLPNRLAL